MDLLLGLVSVMHVKSLVSTSILWTTNTFYHLEYHFFQRNLYLSQAFSELLSNVQLLRAFDPQVERHSSCTYCQASHHLLANISLHSL